jgi:hypothetical protein
MESVALKRAVVIAVVCMLLSFFLYWNLRNVTNEDAKRKDEKIARQETPAKPLAPGKMSWSLDEVIDAYSRQRDNAYLQYVMLQLANNEKRTADVIKQFPDLDPASRRRGEAHSVDLFSLFSGYHAIQESLQLDVMLPGQAMEETQTKWIEVTETVEVPETVERNGVKETVTKKHQVKKKLWDREVVARQADDKPAEPRKPTPLEKLIGPTVKSHPWDAMLADKKPKVSELARCVPADFYLVEFRTMTKLLDTLDARQDWTTYFFTQAHLDATDLRTRQRIQTQLLLDDSPAQRPFYDAIVQNVAIAGSDPFVKEGSDVTMLFQFQSPAFFHPGMERMQESVRKQYPNVRTQKGHHLGIEFTALTTPDRTVSLYVAEPTSHLHIRSNSLAGLKRVLETTLGKTPSLGDTAEFRYIRTLMPMGTAEEDGLIYLSDAFVRRLIGPTTKITEARRLIGYNHLRMIAHAAQMYRTQFGKAPKSLADLEQAKCTPGKFNEGKLACPFGGKYNLSDDGALGVSTILGTTQFLTPCCELPTLDASPQEADNYERFLKDYERYWRTYFDPIAIRLQTSAKRIRIETLVLPLIDNSIYTSLAQVVGNQPEALDALPVPARNLFSLNFRVNREAFIETYGTKARMQRAKIARVVNFIAAPATPFYPSSVPAFAWEDMKNVEPIPSPLENDELKKLGFSTQKLDALIEKGLGNQIGLHYYDARIMFDINLTQFLGSFFQAAARTGIEPSERNDEAANATGLLLGSGMTGYAFLLSSTVAPVYMAMPVKDARVVDDFLDHLDPILAKASTLRYDDPTGFSRFAADFYHLQNKLDTKVRAFGVRYGPIRYRLYWARIGDGLYLTNQPYVLDDIYAARLNTTSLPTGPTGHAMMRMRPEHWKLALDGYKLGWAENNREACQRNQSMLSAAARAFSASPPVSKLAAIEVDRERLVFDYAKKMYGVDFACPDGGRYVLGPDGKGCRCSVHGTLDLPKQPSAPAKNSHVDRLMRDFKDLHATVTILPEGLRAVVVIERK